MTNGIRQRCSDEYSGLCHLKNSQQENNERGKLHDEKWDDYNEDENRPEIAG